MSVEEVKKELMRMEAPALQELTSYILQLRQSLDPKRKEKLSGLIDAPKNEWISWEEADERLGEE